MMQHVCGFANMLTFLGFLICMFERYSYYFILFDLLLIFSRLMSLTLQKLWKAISDSNAVISASNAVAILFEQCL